ncbi:MAG TPA: exosortase-associated EpsI family protein [Gemmataceae bacterium]|nr:exosortase-associated EpsI family protein [Gemmataceae bacterium]
MIRSIPLLAGLIVVIGVAVVQGVWTQRWQTSADLETAVERLAHAPGNLGSWKAEAVEFDAEALTEAGAQGSWVRRYTDARTGASVLVILLCGRSGKMSVHQPEHCYRGAGYEMMAAPVRHKVPGDHPTDCWTTKFRKEETTGDVQLRIFWTWFGDGAWQAPDSPRVTFAHLPALYKLYAIHELPSRQGRLEQDPSLDLLQQLLPALADVLVRP